MIKINYFFLCLLSLAHLTGCNSNEKLDTSEEATYIIDATRPSLSTDSLISPRELLIDVEYISLTSSDTFFLTQAKKILELDNKLYILDANKRLLVAYDLQGNFIGQVGKKGMGPKEYKEVTDFIVDVKRNTVLIFSRADQSILEYGSDLSFKRKVRLNIWAFQMSLLESGNIAFYTFFNEGGNNILVYNFDGEQVSSRMAYPENNQYTPMDYTGFIIGNYYTYPLSSKIFRIEEDKPNDSVVFDITFPGRRQEDKKFDHASFLEPKNWMQHHILSKFTIGASTDELLFYYSFRENSEKGYTLGAKLSGGQVFGHRHLKHGFKSHSDIFVKMFFLGPYNLPTYSSVSGYYYVATDIESMTDFFYNNITSSLKQIEQIDKDLYNVLKDEKDPENPILMKFKLRKKL